MILEFKTARNANGNRKYLAIDTEAKVYTTFSPRMFGDGIEVKTKDYRDLIDKLKNYYGFKEVERVY